MSKPVSRSVDTFRLGRRTNAMNATHSAMPWRKEISVKNALKSPNGTHHCVHQQPVARHHPNAHNRDWHGEAEQLGRREAPTAAQWHSMAIGARTDDVLAHREQQESERDGRNDWKESFVESSTNFRLSSRTHWLYKRRTASAWSRRRRTSRAARSTRPMAGTARGWCRASRSPNLCRENLLRKIKFDQWQHHTCIVRHRLAGQQIVGAFALPLLLLLARLLLHVEAAEAAVHDEQDGDQAGWHSRPEQLNCHHFKVWRRNFKSACCLGRGKKLIRISCFLGTLSMLWTEGKFDWKQVWWTSREILIKNLWIDAEWSFCDLNRCCVDLELELTLRRCFYMLWQVKILTNVVLIKLCETGR